MSDTTKPDYYTSLEELERESKNYINTNPRYSNFFQTHFTAGDIEQFQSGRMNGVGGYTEDNDNNKNLKTKKETKKETDKNLEKSIFKKYKNLNTESVDNTFFYIFHKFKKGIFVKIQNNKLHTFLPFSKKNFTNEWGSKIKIDPKYGDVYGFLKHICEMEGREYNERRVNRFTDTWYANNCLLRHEFPVNEGCTGDAVMRDMLIDLCENRQVPDIEFFLNRRDFPILRRDGKESYDHIFEDCKLLSHNYSSYAPILSMTTTEKHADIAVPTPEDWARINYGEKYFEKFVREFLIDEKVKNMPFEKRINKAVFRGASTGWGVTTKTNPRLRLAELSLKHPDKLDCGITSWCLRPRKIKGEKYLKTIEIKNLNFGLSGFMSPTEQARYKYIVNVDGHVSAYRLGLELSSGSCVLLVNSDYKMWYHKYLVPYEHYIPVKNVEEILKVIEWCENNGKKCEEIANNARIFYEKFLTKEGIFDEWEKNLNTLKKACGNYVYNSVEIKPEIKVKNIEFDFDNSETIFESKLSIVKRWGDLCAKMRRRSENLNESSPSQEYRNDIFVYDSIKNLQGFCKIHGFCENSLIFEYIPGFTMKEWIEKSFEYDIYLKLMFEIFVILQIAQDVACFTHNDLTPWNIILKKDEQERIYKLRGRIYRFYGLCPIIIDYGKSSVMRNNVMYSISKETEFSHSQDLLTLLVTSVSCIVMNSKKPVEENKILHLMNYIAFTDYFPQKFVKMSQVKYFLVKNKKYAELVYAKKGDLESRTLLGFLDYMKVVYEKEKVDECSEYTSGSLASVPDIGNIAEILNNPEKTLKILNEVERIETELEYINTDNKNFYSLRLRLIKINSLRKRAKNIYKENLRMKNVPKKYRDMYRKILSILE